MLIRRHGNGLPAGGLECLEAAGGEIRDISSRDLDATRRALAFLCLCATYKLEA